jgi:hypothetical protein
MNKLKCILTIGAIVACAWPLMGQQKRISPHETISKVIDGNRVTIVYGRPYTKDPTTGQIRKIWGELVPYGKPMAQGALAQHTRPLLQSCNTANAAITSRIE